MIILMTNILDNCFLQGLADAERCIPLLPREASLVGKGPSYPTRRISLECVDQVGNGNRRRYGSVQMDMLWPAVNLDHPSFVESRNRAYIGMKAMSPARIDKGSSALGAPNNMELYTKIFSCHTLITRRWANWRENPCRKCRAFGAQAMAVTLSRPNGRAYALPVLRTSPEKVQTPDAGDGTSSGVRWRSLHISSNARSLSATVILSSGIATCIGCPPSIENDTRQRLRGAMPRTSIPNF